MFGIWGYLVWLILAIRLFAYARWLWGKNYRLGSVGAVGWNESLSKHSRVTGIICNFLINLKILRFKIGVKSSIVCCKF
jgi:hypothetical protein